MNRLFFALALGSALISPALGGGTVTWPPAPLPPGANSATIPAPRLDWFIHFQHNLDESKKMPTLNLIFDGDSITDNWQSRGKDVWAKRYAQLGAFDFGISGDRTENLLWRFQNGQLDNLHPKLVALMIGTNNMTLNSVEQIADGVKAVVVDYRKRCPEAVILIQAIFPRAHLPTDPVRAKIKAVNQIISQLADGKKILYLDFGDKFLEPDGTISAEMMPDFLHPAPQGYEIWADAIQAIVDKYVPAPAPAQ